MDIQSINWLLNLGLLGLLLLITLLLVASTHTLTTIVLATLFSFTLCSLFVILDAVDVAFTEAAVGAGISSVLFFSAVRLKEELRTHKDKQFRWPSISSLLIALALGVVLLWGTSDMPLYGQPDAPIHTYLVPRYLTDSASEIGIPNVVTSILASYRGYDTLGEVVVIFTAGLAVFILLGGAVKERNNAYSLPALITQPILKTVLIRIIPLVLLFALYVQFHGDYGPGGGFQAGVIFGAGLITFGLLTEAEKLLQVISQKGVNFLAAVGVLIYAGVGVVSLFMGGEFLNYSVLASDQVTGQHLGILLIELGVGITVAFTMLSLYLGFNLKRGSPDDAN